MMAGQNYSPNFDREAHLRKKLNTEDEAFFVAEDADGIQGFVTIRGHSRRNSDVISRIGARVRNILSKGRLSTQPTRNVASIDHIIMNPDKRTNYLALGLLKATMQWCKERKLSAIEGTVWSGNSGVLKVGEVVGFKPVRVLLRKDLTQ